jgi:WD40 repeat protein
MKLSRSIQEESFCLDLVRNGNLIAGQTSSNFIKLFDTSSLSTITTLDAQDLCPPEPVSNPQRDQGTIKAIEWIDEQTLICAVDSSLGAIAAFDLRTGQVSQMFEVDRPVLSLSINKGKTLLVAGSEQRFTKSGNEAAMMFYDLRNASSLISKFEVHSDDVTCLEFNPYHSNQLISGSTDGLTLPSKKQVH